jgi:hypothetical protein
MILQLLRTILNKLPGQLFLASYFLAKAKKPAVTIHEIAAVLKP